MIITYLAKSFNQASVLPKFAAWEICLFLILLQTEIKIFKYTFFLFRNVISICKWLIKKWLKLVVGAVLENFYYLLSDISQFPLIGDNPYFSIFNAKYFAIVVSPRREYHVRTWRQGIIQWKLQQQHKKKKKKLFTRAQKSRSASYISRAGFYTGISLPTISSSCPVPPLLRASFIPNLNYSYNCLIITQ